MAATADMVFNDKNVAKSYALVRPQPPPSIVHSVIQFWKKGKLRNSSTTSHLVDVGCGNGQSTVLYSEHLVKITGIDCSEEQIMEAKKNHENYENVDFRVGRAEILDFPDTSVDIVTVCAALHWFDLPAFYKEVDRILRPGGILATYSYIDLVPYFNNQSLKSTMQKLREGIGFFSPHHRHLLNEFDTLDPPYKETEFISSETGQFVVCIRGTLDYFRSYCSSYAPLLKYRKKFGDAAAEEFIAGALKMLKENMDTEDENPPMEFKYSYFLRIWRKPALNVTISGCSF